MDLESKVIPKLLTEAEHFRASLAASGRQE